MEQKQEDALEVLKQFRDFIKGKAYHMASISWGELSTNQGKLDTERLVLVQELHENYECEDDGLSVRRVVKNAFGTYPFARIAWDVFEDWDKDLLLTEKVDYIYEHDLVNDNEDFNVEEIGRPYWVHQCLKNAEQLLENVIRQINSFIVTHSCLDVERKDNNANK